MPKSRKVNNPKELIEYLMNSKTRKFGIPLLSYIEITNRCNFRCVHCYCSSWPNKKVMTYREICSVLNQLADIGSLFVVISGGEPLVSPDFWKIMEHAKKRNFAITLNTNGSLITEDVAQRLANLSLVKIDLSMYGMDESTYKYITGVSGAFEKVVKCVKLLKEKGTNIFVKIILMRENFPQVEVFEKFLKKIGVDGRFFTLTHPRLNRCQTPLKHNPTKSQIEKFFYSYPEYCEPELESKPPPSGLVCGPGSGDLVCINAYGEVMPCLMLGNHTNIREKSIAEILKQDPLFLYIRNLRWKNMPECFNCKALLYCSPCPGYAVLETGSFTSTAPKTLCRLAWIKKRVHERLSKYDTSTFKVSGKCPTE